MPTLFSSCNEEKHRLASPSRSIPQIHTLADTCKAGVTPPVHGQQSPLCRMGKSLRLLLGCLCKLQVIPWLEPGPSYNCHTIFPQCQQRP